MNWSERTCTLERYIQVFCQEQSNLFKFCLHICTHLVDHDRTSSRYDFEFEIIGIKHNLTRIRVFIAFFVLFAFPI